MATRTALEKVIEVLGGRRALAQLCGVSYSAVQQWEANGIPRDHLLKIEIATGISVHELLGGRPPKKEAA
jgi:DNA-binding transcriptional regulator YdaS (Cro superfamily)